MPHDVFICYSSRDKPVVEELCAALESDCAPDGPAVRCWVAPRDVVAGTEWSAAIVDAIAASRAVVCVYSAHANSSPQVLRELHQAVDSGVTIVPFMIQDVPPHKSVAYYIGTSHWLDATAGPIAGHIRTLRRTVRGMIDGGATTPATTAAAPAARYSAPELALLRRYCEQLRRTIAAHGVVTRDARVDAPRERYVERTVLRDAADAKAAAGGARAATATAADLPRTEVGQWKMVNEWLADRSAPLLITGELGMGKSRLLEAMADRLAAAATAEMDSAPGAAPTGVPLLVQLQLYGQPDRGTLKALLRHADADQRDPEARENAVLRPADPAWHGLLDKLLADGRLVVLLDGYDEILPARRVELRRALEHYDRSIVSRLAMTSRPGYGAELALRSALHCDLTPLTDADVAAYVACVCEGVDDPDPLAAARAALANGLGRLMRRPLFLRAWCAMLLHAGRSAASMHELMEFILDETLARRQALGEADAALTVAFRDWYAGLAFRAACDGFRNVSLDQLAASLPPGSAHRFDLAAVRAGLLVSTAAGGAAGGYAVPKMPLVEYLAGRHLARLAAAPATAAAFVEAFRRWAWRVDLRDALEFAFDVMLHAEPPQEPLALGLVEWLLNVVDGDPLFGDAASDAGTPVRDDLVQSFALLALRLLRCGGAAYAGEYPRASDHPLVRRAFDVLFGRVLPAEAHGGMGLTQWERAFAVAEPFVAPDPWGEVGAQAAMLVLLARALPEFPQAETAETFAFGLSGLATLVCERDAADAVDGLVQWLPQAPDASRWPVAYGAYAAAQRVAPGAAAAVVRKFIDHHAIQAADVRRAFAWGAVAAARRVAPGDAAAFADGWLACLDDLPMRTQDVVINVIEAAAANLPAGAARDWLGNANERFAPRGFLHRHALALAELAIGRSQIRTDPAGSYEALRRLADAGPLDAAAYARQFGAFDRHPPGSLAADLAQGRQQIWTGGAAADRALRHDVLRAEMGMMPPADADALLREHAARLIPAAADAPVVPAAAAAPPPDDVPKYMVAIHQIATRAAPAAATEVAAQLTDALAAPPAYLLKVRAWALAALGRRVAPAAAAELLARWLEAVRDLPVPLLPAMTNAISGVAALVPPDRAPAALAMLLMAAPPNADPSRAPIERAIEAACNQVAPADAAAVVHTLVDRVAAPAPAVADAHDGDSRAIAVHALIHVSPRVAERDAPALTEALLAALDRVRPEHRLGVCAALGAVMRRLPERDRRDVCRRKLGVLDDVAWVVAGHATGIALIAAAADAPEAFALVDRTDPELKLDPDLRRAPAIIRNLLPPPAPAPPPAAAPLPPADMGPAQQWRHLCEAVARALDVPAPKLMARDDVTAWRAKVHAIASRHGFANLSEPDGPRPAWVRAAVFRAALEHPGVLRDASALFTPAATPHGPVAK